MRELSIISDGALLIRDGFIEEVGPARRVENLAGARDALEIDARRRVVMPGFVDCHTHLATTLAVSTGQQIGPHAIRTASVQRLVLRGERYVHSMVRHGTTSLEAKSWHESDAGIERKVLRVLSKLNRKPVDIAVTQVNPALLKSGRSVDFFCHESPAALAAARKLGLAIKAETRGGVRAALECDAISVAHLEEASAEDVALLAQSVAIAVLLPAYTFYQHASRYAPARELIDQGAAVALGTDFEPGRCPVFSMQTAIWMACAHMGMDPAEAIAAATTNAAHAIRRGSRIGSLEIGKQADLIVLDITDYRELGRTVGMNLVALTIKKGVPVYREADVGGV